MKKFCLSVGFEKAHNLLTWKIQVLSFRGAALRPHVQRSTWITDQTLHVLLGKKGLDSLCSLARHLYVPRKNTSKQRCQVVFGWCVNNHL